MADSLQIAFFPSWAGPGELVLLFALILVLFGPRRLPEIARAIGRVLADLRRASDDFRNQVMGIEDEVEQEVRRQLTTAPDVDADEPCSAQETGDAQGTVDAEEER